MMRRARSRQDDAAPGLLLAFLAATLTMVVAVALLLQGSPGWDDAVAIALLLALAALVLLATGRKLGEDEQPGDELDADGRRRRGA